jgi:trehalose/maltose transport system permease protein
MSAAGQARAMRIWAARRRRTETRSGRPHRGWARVRKPKKLKYNRLGLYIVLAVILVYILFPFYWVIRSSLSTDSEIFATPVEYWPQHATLANFAAVLTNGGFLRAILNSAIVAASVTVIGLIVGSLAAYALGRFSFRGRSVAMYCVLGMTVFPQVAILGALYTMIRAVGLYNSLGALVGSYMIFTLPFTIWVLTMFFRTMPKDLEEAAYIDGASPFQTFRKIMLPLAAPGFVTTGILAFVSSWNEFLYALSFELTPNNRTIPLAIFDLSNTVASAYQVPWGDIMAATVIVTVPLVVLVLVFQKRIIAGLTAGAVKG